MLWFLIVSNNRKISIVDLALCQPGMVLFHTHFTRCRGESGTAAELGLARRLGWSARLLNKRMNTGKYSVEEWERIGRALGAKSRVGFVLPDGREM